MRVFLALLLLFSGQVAEARLSLFPAQIADGGVALLRWQGEPPASAIARFNDEVFPLTPDADGASALLGVDLGSPAGTYPVAVAVTDARGRTTFAHADVRVVNPSRPVETLTLPEKMVRPREPAILARIARESRELQEVFAGRSAGAVRGFLRPVKDPIGSVFGLKRILNGEPRSPHSGIDFRSPLGTEVRAPAEGRVVLARDLYFTGRTVILDHGEGLFSLYAHLDRVVVRQGEGLAAGVVLGMVGSTGRSTGPHLHWGVKLRGGRVDPRALLELGQGENP